MPHEVHTGPEGAVVIDVFAPVRADWQALERLGLAAAALALGRHADLPRRSPSLGPGGDPARPLEEQSDWPAHAAFMDGLVYDGFVVLGGPLADEHRVVHVIEAGSEDEIRARLAQDPWSDSHLRIESIDPWTIRLDGRPVAETPALAAGGREVHVVLRLARPVAAPPPPDRTKARTTAGVTIPLRRRERSTYGRLLGS